MTTMAANPNPAAPTTAQPAAPTVMDLLRDSTMDNHKAAERHPLQRALATGTLPQTLYVDFHAQMYLVHSALESRLMEKAAATPAIARVVKLYQISAPYLARDLAHFGVDPCGVKPVPATTVLTQAIDAMAKADPVSLLGLQYVLEGSKNGAKFLSRVVMKAYGLAPGRGVLSMDPYGDAQRAYWQAFKDDMNGIGFSPDQTARMIDAAKAMFDAIAAIGTDVVASSGLTLTASDATH